MKAIIKKDMRLFFNRTSSYVLMAITLFFSSALVIIFNMLYGSSVLSSTFLYIINIMMFIVPAGAFMSFREDDKVGFSEFAFSLPMSSLQIIFGKTLSLFLQFCIPCSILILFPLILKPAGNLNIASAYFSVIVFAISLFLISAFTVFIFTLVKNRIAAMIVSALLSYLLFNLAVISDFISSKAYVSLIGFAILAIIIFLAVFFSTKKVLISLIIPGAVLVAALAVFFINPELIQSSFAKVLALISPFERFTYLSFDIADLFGMLFSVSLALFFAFLASLATEKKRIFH